MPAKNRERARPALAVLLVLLAVALVAGCSDSSGGVGPSKSTATHSSSSPAAPASGRATSGEVDVRVDTWSVDDGVVFLKVTNDSAVEIRSARAVITTRDAAGTVIATVSGPPQERCCTVLALPPGGTYGLYATVGAAASRVRSVDVQYTDVSLGKVGSDPGSITVANATLLPGTADAVVTATITPTAVLGSYATALAYLNGPHGTFVAVIIGRYYCLQNGMPLSIRMELFHSVPAGTTLDKVIAYPIPGDLTTATSALPGCAT